MAKYSSEALDVVLAEVGRLRALQVARIGNLRATAGLVLGASGIAGGLISAAAGSAWWLMPLSLFLLAALASLLVLIPNSGRLVQPLSVFAAAENKRAIQVKSDVVTGLIAEHTGQEELLESLVWKARLAVLVFVLGVVALVFTAAFGSAGDSKPLEIKQPIIVQIEE